MLDIRDHPLKCMEESTVDNVSFDLINELKHVRVFKGFLDRGNLNQTIMTNQMRLNMQTVILGVV